MAALLTWRIRRPMQTARDATVPVLRAWAALAESLRYIGPSRGCWRW